jgi:uncharacterized membrane protein YpjA
MFFPFAIYYMSVAPIGAFVNDIIDYPIHYYGPMRRLPFPGAHALLHNPADLGVYFPILAVLLGAARLAAFGKAGSVQPVVPPNGGHLIFLVVFVPLTAILFYKGAIRVSWIHMLMSIVPAILVLAILADWLWGQRPWQSLLATLLLFIAAAPPAFATMSHGGWKTWTPLGRLLSRAGLVRLKAEAHDECPPTSALTLAWLDPDHSRVTEYIRRFSQPRDMIFIGLSRHDKIFANPVVLYFSTDRRPGTHWHQFDPGLQTRADIQSDIIADLRRNRVRWAIRDASFETIYEPNQSGVSSGVHLLDRYLDANYRPVAASGLVQIWLIKGEQAPSPPYWPACGAKPSDKGAAAR